MDEKLREALGLGRDLYRQRDFARAEPYLAQVTAAQLPYADVYNMLGVIHHDAGQFSKAHACFQEALRINPAYTEASLNLAVTYNDMGRYAEARDLYLGALTTSTRPGAKLDSFVMGKLANMYADIAEVYVAAGAWDEAIAEFRRALALRPTFVDLRVRLAQALRDAQRLDEALRELRAVLAQSPDYLPARLSLGLTLFSKGDHAASLHVFEAVLQKEPEHHRARVFRDMIR
ncbi:MAG: tetratricopeptide repeat protein, partial [Deltaproteobacteria bacterium]|nr:tetratricopeptide repeat protein [Deltaproteobacteria bacterium]